MDNKQKREAAKMAAAQNEQLRAQVQEQELSARSWKAYYEKMYYTIESQKIEDEYNEVKKKIDEKIAAQRKQFEEFMKTMQENQANLNGENPLGVLKVDAVEKDETPVIQMNAE